MPTQYFTLEEANHILVEIRPMMERNMAHRDRVIESRSEIQEILRRENSDIGGGVASELVQDFSVIEQLSQRIRSYGCQIKDLNAGLVDFLSLRDGREVYLCWRYGEPNIGHYHELHTGFKGRKPV